MIKKLLLTFLTFMTILNSSASAEVIVGQCGSDNGGSFPYSFANLNDTCASGDTSNIVASISSYDWVCYGRTNGVRNLMDADCSATREPIQIPGTCGSGGPLDCNNGSPIDDNGVTTCGMARTWVCTGTNGGSNSGTCSHQNTPCPVNGACGDVFPGQCVSGDNDGSLSYSGSTASWRCYGSNGGSDSGQCSMIVPDPPPPEDPPPPGPTDGSCNNSTPLGCNAGFATNDNGQSACGTTRQWICAGQDGGTDSGTCSYANPVCTLPTGTAACDTTTPGACLVGVVTYDNGQTACGTNRIVDCSTTTSVATCVQGNSCGVNGVCGTANGVSSSTPPSANLCSAGTQTAVTGTVSAWNWNCEGTGGGSNSSCTAPKVVNGACGPADGSNVYSAPTSGLCSTGDATTVSGAGPFTWNCNGRDGGTNDSCQANLAVNGECGASHNTAQASPPSTGLCNAGTASIVTGSGPYLWTCNGLNSGANASCTSLSIIQGVCGPANNTPTATAPASDLCTAGTATAVTGTGPWTWSCTGSGGGSASQCTAPTPPPPPSFGGACPT